MTEESDYWSLWARYWAYIEDFFLDIDVIDKLTGFIQSPVLIVGAGQGILVERLLKKGFRVDGVDLNRNMVALAKSRRGINLVEANAVDLPFGNGIYKTSIIATGVLDFLDGDEEILSILREVTRVTNHSGRVLAAFCQFHPRVESFFRRSRLITDSGLLCFRRLHEMTKLSSDDPIGYIRALKSDANVGYCRAVIMLMRALVFVPRKHLRALKRFARLWKLVRNEQDNPEALIECGPEYIPYRKKEDIKDLFKRLDVPISGISAFDSCIVVQLNCIADRISASP